MSTLASEFIRTWIEDNIVPEMDEEPDRDAARSFVRQLISDAEDAGIEREELEEDGDDLTDLVLKAMSEPSQEDFGPTSETDT